jgi:hypothetical protein
MSAKGDNDVREPGSAQLLVDSAVRVPLVLRDVINDVKRKKT